MKGYTYETCCMASAGNTLLHGAAINDMRDHPKNREVQYETMLHHCAGLLDWSVKNGYELDRRRGLTLRSDCYVGYHKSFYKGQPCFYLVWSAIEFIWTKG